MSTHRRRFLRFCSVVGLGAIAGCSGSEQEGATPASSGTSTSVQSPAVTLTPTATKASAGGTQQTNFAPNDGDSNDFFGSSVAVSSDGTTALIGAYRDEDPNGEYAGSAYIFDSSGGSWTQQAKLAADDGSDDEFSSSVALSSDGTTALIGAPNYEDSNGDGASSAYVFDGSGGSWTQQATFAPDDSDAEHLFGWSVALSGDGTIALIGAADDDESNSPDTGSVYIFDVSSGSWTQHEKLTADDSDSHDNFGASISVSSDGSTALVGAASDEDSNGENAGSAYVFDGSGGSWTQQAKLTADDGDSSDNFGASVALSSDATTALIGAVSDEDPNGDDAGSVYAFNSAGGSWTQQAKLSATDGDSDDEFGESVALSSNGTIALMGARFDENANGSSAGSAYVFDGSGNSWTQQAKFVPNDGGSYDYFGASVALSNDATTALIGTIGDEDPNGRAAGSVYVFNR